MKKKTLCTLYSLALGLLAIAAFGDAQTPTTFTFQGRLDENGHPLTGLYDMTFQLFASVDQNNAASELRTINAVPVTNGLFAIGLDFGSAPFEMGEPRWLEVSVKTNGSSNPYSALPPRTALTSAPYAIYAYNARSVSSGAISNAQLAGDAVTASKIASGQVVKSLNGLKDEVSLTAGANITLTPDTSGNSIQISASTGPAGGWGLSGNTISAGQFLGPLNNLPLEIRAPSGVGLGTPSPVSSLHLLNQGSTYLTIEKPSTSYESGLQFRTGGANQWWLFANDTTDDLQIESAGETDAWPRLRFPAANHDILLGLSGGGVGIGTAQPTARLTVAADYSGGAVVVGSASGSINPGYSLTDETGRRGVLGMVSGSGGWLPAGRAGDFELVAPGNGRLRLGLSPVLGEFSVAASIMSLAGSKNYPRVGIGMDDPAWALDVHANQAVGRFTSSSTINGSVIELRNDTPSADYLGAINFNDAAGSYSGQIGYHANGAMTFRAGGVERMRIQGNTVTVPVLTITGGADLAEPFEISTPEIAKGSLVVIDAENPGHLKLSQRAYDTRLAGIISGANGVKPGISLHQEGTLEGGQNVALSGRVYALADASNGSIQPGDLLTSSDSPGHCMKVTDPARAQGAIIGKAMTGLAAGQGTVLVLVSLQ